MDPWDLILKQKYADAVELYRLQSADTSKDPPTLSNYGTALLCVENLVMAKKMFERANTFANKEMRGKSRPYLCNIATVQWLMGKPGDAIKTVTASVNGILDGSIHYADMAGGVSQGLMLWYFGFEANDAAAQELAKKYLQKLVKRSRIKWWPGPIAQYMMGQKKREDVLVEACGTKDECEAIQLAKSDTLKRRELVNALFYFAVRERMHGNEEKCRRLMRECVGLENPYLEEEWFLARAEVDAFEK